MFSINNNKFEYEFIKATIPYGFTVTNYTEASVCCGDYANCRRACYNRGYWQCEQDFNKNLLKSNINANY